MKLLTLSLLLTFTVSAHDGGHGTVAEGGKFGGITAPVVDLAQARQGEKATTLYKAELVRAASGKLSLYLFDTKMVLLSPDAFAPEAEANLEVKKKGKFMDIGKFTFKRVGNHFEAQLPAVEYKPFNIDVNLKRGAQRLFSGFSNLD